MKLIYYKQQGCAPCDEKLPVAEQIAAESGVEMVVWDVAEHQELAAKHKVRATPTLVLIDENDGERAGGWYGKLIDVRTVPQQVRRICGG